MNGSTRGTSLLLALVVLALWIAGLYFLFRHFLRLNYFYWYVKNGSMISIAASLLAFIWGKLDEEQKKLLSSNPYHFMSACWAVAGIFFQALGALLNSFSLTSSTPQRLSSALSDLWDATWTIVVSLLMAIAVMSWLLVVAPLFYLSTLITGAPARWGMRGNQRIVYTREDWQADVRVLTPWEPVPEDAVELSLADQPFAFTNAINAGVLYAASRMVDHFHVH